MKNDIAGSAPPVMHWEGLSCCKITCNLMHNYNIILIQKE